MLKEEISLNLVKLSPFYKFMFVHPSDYPPIYLFIHQTM